MVLVLKLTSLHVADVFARAAADANAEAKDMGEALKMVALKRILRA